MINLITISSALNRHRWLLISLILGFLFLVLILIQFAPKSAIENQSPITPIVFQKQPVTTRSLDSQNINLPSSYPQSLPTYQKIITEALTTKAPSIAQKLGFTQAPQSLSGDINFGDGVFYSGNNSLLAVYQNFLSYRKTLPAAANINPAPSELKVKAVNFLSSLGLTVNFSDNFDVSYQKTVDEFSTTTADSTDANQITITLKYLLSGTTVIDTQKAITGTFDMSGNLIKINYHDFEATESSQKYKIITPQQALGKINSAALISVTSPDYNPTPPSLENVTLSQAALGYYISEEETIQPVWVFYGSAAGNVLVKYAVPAIPQAAN